MKVLVIDDEKPVRTAIKAALSAEGMNITAAGNAVEALAFLKTGNFDVVLLDILMPGTDGFSLLKDIRNQRLFVPVKDLVQAEKEVATAGTPLNKYYKLVQEV